MRQGPEGRDLVRRAGHEVIDLSAGAAAPGSDDELIEAVRCAAARALVLDVRDDLSRAAVQRIRELGVRTVIIDDGSERRLAADLAFYPPVPQVARLDWAGFSGRRFVGWEWIILRPQFAQQRPGQGGPRLRVLVTMGGSDPAGLTLRAVEAIGSLDLDFDTDVLVGSAFAHERRLDALLRTSQRPIRVLRGVEDVAGLMAEADLAVAAFGITAYELAAVGVPAIHLCLTADHAESATALAQAGVAVSLGIHDAVTTRDLANALRRALLVVPTVRQQIAARGRALIDGRGASRVVEHIRAELNG